MIGSLNEVITANSGRFALAIMVLLKRNNEAARDLYTVSLFNHTLLIM
jgi:hypothetical protein